MFAKLPNGLSYRLPAGVTGVDSATTGNMLLKMSSENNPSLLPVPGARYISDSALLYTGHGHGYETHALANPHRVRVCCTNAHGGQRGILVVFLHLRQSPSLNSKLAISAKPARMILSPHIPTNAGVTSPAVMTGFYVGAGI